MRIIKMANEDDFSAEVQVSIYDLEKSHPGMMEDEAYWKATIPFRIDIEYRSWGIKDINVIPFGNVTVPVSMSAETDEQRAETVNVVFDAGQLRINKEPADRVTLGEVILMMNPDMTPDYEKSTITVYGPTRTE